MKAQHLQQGEQAEQACYLYLRGQGLKLVEKNFHCRMGEIDIIMLDQKNLVFIEVRFRKNNTFGGAEASITLQKQRKIRRTAELYLQQHTQFPNARFDVVAMSPSAERSQFHPDNVNYTFNWIKNAF